VSGITKRRRGKEEKSRVYVHFKKEGKGRKECTRNLKKGFGFEEIPRFE
jgi:hypothetical protein